MSDTKQRAREMFDAWFNSSGFDHNSSCGCFGDCDCKSPREKMHTNLDQIIYLAIAEERAKISMLYRNWKIRPEADDTDFDDVISKLD